MASKDKKIKWKNNINIVKEWDKAEKKKITINELATILMKKIKKLKVFTQDKDLKNIYDKIEDSVETSKDKDMSIKKFNKYMDELYDWGDDIVKEDGESVRKCWIVA
jgi:hypothetical protein